MTEATQAASDPGSAVVAEITQDGYLRLPGEFAQKNFPQDRCAGLRQDDSTFILMPVSPIAPNALIMKQRSLAGERSVLIREVCGDDYPVGRVEATWLGGRRRLVIPVHPPKGES